MPDDEVLPRIPTTDNIRRFVMGDEVSQERMRTPAPRPLSTGNPYGEVIMPANNLLWARRVLPLRTTVLVNLAILATINRPWELWNRIVGLLLGGISVEEIQEVILHIGFYVGNPAGVEAGRALREAIDHLDQRGIPFNEKTREAPE